MSHFLFEPLTLRGVTFRNRVWVPPMCQYVVEAKDGAPTDWHTMHWGSFARGGAGAVIVEATGVVPEGRISPEDLGLWNDEQVAAFAPRVAFAKSLGTRMGIQLAHAGRKASTYREWDPEGRDGSVPVGEGGWETVAPSAVPFQGLATPRAATAEDIEEIVEAFAASARRALQAGFEFVEIHAAHGYLLHEFLSPLSNQRTDEYGGSEENRARLLLRVVDAVREAVGEDVPVLVRLSATDWAEGGVDQGSTNRLAATLSEHGVDLIDVSTGGNVVARIPVGPGYQVRFAAGVKSAVDVPVGAVGMIDSSFQAEQILATGQADVVLCGREYLRDPSLALHFAHELRVSVDYVPRPYHRAFR